MSTCPASATVVGKPARSSLPFNYIRAGSLHRLGRRTSTPPPICRRPTTIRSSTDIRRHLRDVINPSGQLSHPTATVICAGLLLQPGRCASTPLPTL